MKKLFHIAPILALVLTACAHVAPETSGNYGKIQVSEGWAESHHVLSASNLPDCGGKKRIGYWSERFKARLVVISFPEKLGPSDRALDSMIQSGWRPMRGAGPHDFIATHRGYTYPHRAFFKTYRTKTFCEEEDETCMVGIYADAPAGLFGHVYGQILRIRNQIATGPFDG